MSKGKFEAGRKRPSAGKANGKQGGKSGALMDKLWPILVAAGGVAVLAVGILLYVSLSKGNRSTTPTDAMASTETALSREDMIQSLTQLSEQLQSKTLELTLASEDSSAEPIVLTLSPLDTNASIDVEAAKKAMDNGTGKVGDNLYVLNRQDYLKLDEDYVKELADQTAEDYGFGKEFRQTETEEVKEKETAEDGTTEEVTYLVIRPGIAQRDLTAENIVDAVKKALSSGEFQSTLTYKAKIPDTVDVDELYEKYCTDPIDATLDEKTMEIIEEKNGFGFAKEDLQKQLEEAKDGDELRVRLDEFPAEVTKEYLEATLFHDVIGEAHTPHSAIADRTNNLKLACKAIDGTILLPNEVFSFNDIVGERTAEKGYKAAIAYVGGASVPELGGGVCQVASSIYYACLQADLIPKNPSSDPNGFERHPHYYLVDYVPGGMDAAIYWGLQNYKFRNTTPYPIRIEASVSDGKVHIVLKGTEWKDYTVKMSYEVLETFEPEVVEREVPNDGTYRNGEVIATPHRGYKIEVFKSTYDSSGKRLSIVSMGTSRYNKQDKVIAVLAGTKPPEPPVTEPPATEPPATVPPTTEPPVTEPPVTEPPVTEPSTTEEAGG